MRDLAGSTTLGTLTPVELYAGEAPIVTGDRQAATGVAFAKYEVFAEDATGKAIKHNPGGTAPATIAVGIFMQPVAAGGQGPVLLGGALNHEALVWHASLTTLEARRAQFNRTPIYIKKLL